MSYQLYMPREQWLLVHKEWFTSLHTVLQFRLLWGRLNQHVYSELSDLYAGMRR